MSLSWLFQLFGWLSLLLWCVLAAFTALFAEMQSRASLRGISGWKLLVFTALNWAGWEFIRAELFPLKFPWMTAGLAIGPNSFLPWIGVYGVSIIVVLAAALLATRRWKPALVPLLALAAAALLPSQRLPPAADDPLAVKVGGLQLEGVSLTEFLTGTRELPDDLQYIA